MSARSEACGATHARACAAWNRRAPSAEPSEQEIAAAEREQARNGEVWAILFHDTDMPPAIFYGDGAEDAARRKYHAVRSTYNCVLLAPAVIRRAPSAEARAAAEEMRERAAEVATGTSYHGQYRTWPWWTNPDGSQGNRVNESDVVRHADAIAAAIRALPLTGDET